MHIILGVLGLIVTILVLLNRLAEAGIDLGGLNPFLWRRRRAWRQKFEANPIFSLEDPQEVAGLLVVGVAKIDGEVSAEEKRALLSEFENTFALKPRQASEMLGSSVYILGDADVLRTQLDGVLNNTKDRFTPEQAASLLSMMERIATVDGTPTDEQRQLIEGVRARLSPPKTPEGTWN